MLRRKELVRKDGNVVNFGERLEKDGEISIFSAFSPFSMLFLHLRHDAINNADSEEAPDD